MFKQIGKALVLAGLAVGIHGAAWAQQENATAAPLSKTTQTEYWLHLPAVSHHFDPPLQKGRQWNQTHPALGVELRKPLPLLGDEWRQRWTFGVMKDSLDSWGTYAGAAATRPVWSHGEVTVEAGLSALLFYRKLAFDGRRLLVPAVLPMASVEVGHRWGLNALYVPHLRLSQHEEIPSLLFFQLAHSF